MIMGHSRAYIELYQKLISINLAQKNMLYSLKELSYMYDTLTFP